MIGTVMVPMLLLPRHWFRQFVITWSAGNGMLLRIIAGVHSEIRNREHRPTGAAIIASKHQSEWEAHVFLHELDDPAYVIKRELSFVPGYGWFSAKVNMIFVDREGGAKSLRATGQGCAEGGGTRPTGRDLPRGHAGHAGGEAALSARRRCAL